MSKVVVQVFTSYSIPGAAGEFIFYMCWKARSAIRRTCATQGVHVSASEAGDFWMEITPFQAIKFANFANILKLYISVKSGAKHVNVWRGNNPDFKRSSEHHISEHLDRRQKQDQLYTKI